MPTAVRAIQRRPKSVCHKTVFSSSALNSPHGNSSLICAVISQNQANPETASTANAIQSERTMRRQNGA